MYTNTEPQEGTGVNSYRNESHEHPLRNHTSSLAKVFRQSRSAVVVIR